ncbi:MAG: hypothetical protein AUI11_07465 [Acidobacteria bacterium 13_2_20CM_2_66_4]|nr:MAG: hypothetical protein AUI11_07465 [Acidobacteria bacterium 13_2_20CM_2_66_4]
MEIDIVDEEPLRLLHHREQARDFVGHRRELFGRRALGGEAGGADLEHAARLVHVLAREAVKRREEAQRLGRERGRPVRDVGARSLPRSHDAHRGEGVESGADRRPADANLHGEVALGGQPVAGAQRAAVDEAAHVREHLFRAPFERSHRGFV